MHLTSHITHSNGYAPYIAYYRSNGYDQRFRKLKPKPKLNPPNAHRSQIKICENRQTQNVQFRLMPNAFRILKPIQKSMKRVWVFRNTGANAFAKNQMRLAYEDKRDLYCMTSYGLDEWFWAMFEPTPTWHNLVIVVNSFAWIVANNDQKWRDRCYTSEFEQCSNWLKLDIITLLVNFSCDLRQIRIWVLLPWGWTDDFEQMDHLKNLNWS